MTALPEPLPGAEEFGAPDPQTLVPALEAILFVVESPVSIAALAVAVEAPTPTVQHALDLLRGKMTVAAVTKAPTGGAPSGG